MIITEERRKMVMDILGHELTGDELVEVAGADTLDDVREICYGMARHRAYPADSYRGKARLKVAFLQAMIDDPAGTDVILIEEAFNEALELYKEALEEDG